MSETTTIIGPPQQGESGLSFARNDLVTSPLLERFVGRLEREMAVAGYQAVGPPGPDTRVVLHVLDANDPKPYRRKEAPTFVIAIGELPEPPADLDDVAARRLPAPRALPRQLERHGERHARRARRSLRHARTGHVWRRARSRRRRARRRRVPAHRTARVVASGHRATTSSPISPSTFGMETTRPGRCCARDARWTSSTCYPRRSRSRRSCHRAIFGTSCCCTGSAGSRTETRASATEATASPEFPTPTGRCTG